MATRTQLQAQLEKSRRLLRDKKSSSEKDKTDKSSTVKPTLGQYIRERHLPARTNPFEGPFQKSTADAVSEKTGGFGEIAAERINRMRRGIESKSTMIDLDKAPEPTPNETPLWSESELVTSKERDSSIPVWREVLGEQRGFTRPSKLATHQYNISLEEDSTPPSPLEMVPEERAKQRPMWPPIYTPSSIFTWNDWHTCPQNKLGTTAAKEIITHPCERGNPLLFLGKPGTGKSHILRAIGSSFHTTQPDMEVRLLTKNSFESFTESGWQEAIMGCSCLIIDDADSLNDIDQEELAKLIDHALNCGVQVVVTSGENPFFTSTLKILFESAVEVVLETPSDSALILYLRKRALRRVVSLSDDQLRVIANRSTSWASAAAGFDAVALAIDAGAEPIGSEDVNTILDGGELEMRDDESLIAWDSDSTGKRIVSEVLDDVLPRERQPNIDIVSELESSVDDYQAPDLLPGSSGAAVDALLERHLGREKSALEDARVRLEAAALPTELESPRIGAANLDMMSDGFLDRLESRLRRHQNELFSLHSEMESISDQIDDADAKELVEMADRMLEIERQLSRISRLDAGESLSPRKKPQRPYEPSSIEDFTPVGDWNIDASKVSAEDLIPAPTAILRPVKILKPIFQLDPHSDKKATLKPISILKPSTESEN